MWIVNSHFETLNPSIFSLAFPPFSAFDEDKLRPCIKYISFAYAIPTIKTKQEKKMCAFRYQVVPNSQQLSGTEWIVGGRQQRTTMAFGKKNTTKKKWRERTKRDEWRPGESVLIFQPLNWLTARLSSDSITKTLAKGFSLFATSMPFHSAVFFFSSFVWFHVPNQKWA